VELVILRYARFCPREYWKNHSNAEQALKAWYSEAKYAQWKSPADIKEGYPRSSILPDNRVVFRIKGNNYRLVVKINYDYRQVFIRLIGTHAEYDKIDATIV
jgi:mRNA interferase HigB